MKNLKKALLVACVAIFTTSCASMPIAPEEMSIGLSLAIRSIPSVEVTAASLIVCHVVKSIEAIPAGTTRDIGKMFDQNWDDKTNALAADIQDLLSARLKAQGKQLSGQGRETFEYISRVMSLTCGRLSPSVKSE